LHDENSVLGWVCSRNISWENKKNRKKLGHETFWNVKRRVNSVSAAECPTENRAIRVLAKQKRGHVDCLPRVEATNESPREQPREQPSEWKSK